MSTRLSAPLGALLLTLTVAAPATAATCTWQGGTDTWDTPAAWSCGAVPSPSDDVIVGSGTITIDVAATVRNLTFTGGAIGGPGNLFVTGALVWEAGFMDGEGMTQIDGGTTFQTASSKDIGRRVRLSSHTTWSDATLQMRDGGALVNEAGSLFTDNASGMHSVARVGTITHEPVVLNVGTWIIESAGTNTNVDFYNEGVLAVAGGVFDMHAPGRFVNAPSGIVSGTSPLDFSSGALVVMGGTTMPSGSVAGSFPVRGPFPMSDEHLLDVDITGPGADGYDRLLAGAGDVTVDGRLRLRVSSEAVAGMTFPILSHTGGGGSVIGCYDPDDIQVVAADGWSSVPYTASVTCAADRIAVTLEAAPTAGESDPDGATAALAVTGANPFASRTQLALTAPTSGRVTIEALDALGRRVAVLFDGVAEAGQPVAVAFEAGALPAGLYVVRAVGGGLALSRTVTLTR